MSADPEKEAIRSLRAVAKLKGTLEAENAALKAGRPEAVAALLAEKARNIDALDAALLRFAEAGGDRKQLDASIAEFGQLINENQTLLESSVEAQTQFIQLIFSNADDEEAKGYGATGRYATTSSQGGGLTLQSDI
ncbi:hypothetical protein HW511_01685 [Asaia siamensis]|uniref:FlgN protein n=1 Tax=Asaia siamensis TaxID=110479 RepID=A0ABQ1L747_9PROT|nr:hypothetical protein [Asaia siamensis]GBR09775.1 hypothetical protein AA0323_2588 [Asaia siamensis NRIC 0323]GGC19056.1 hypothetical protein GCM10007207_00380 [Asaia siamensis]